MAVERGRPRVSRETRRLLTTALLSLAALWILARIRFPERPPAPDPVGPLLSQIAPRVGFEDLEHALVDQQSALSPALSVVLAERPAAASGAARDAVVSLRFRPDAELALVGRSASAVAPPAATKTARDRATGLTAFSTPASEMAPLKTWQPARGADYPRYLIAAEAWRDQVVLRPVFFGPLDTTFSALWEAEVWAVPPHVDVQPGAALFTTTGSLVGLLDSADGAVIVPAAVAISAAGRLLAEQPRRPGWLGLEVQPLTRALRTVSGVSGGVIVTFVSPLGPAAGKVLPTDVVEAIGADAVSGTAAWQARVARLAEGDSLVLHLRRGGEGLDVPMSAAALPPPVSVPAAAAPPPLGLRMRYRRGVGTDVLAVDEGSLATKAGIRAGDLLTRVGALEAPTPAQVRREIANAKEGGVLAAVTRGEQHVVLVLGAR